MTSDATITREIRALMAAGDRAGATALLKSLLRDVTGVAVAAATIRADEYSLNSINGFVDLADGQALFFKFHQEENEESGVAEYYNAEILKEAGYPVDVPVYIERRPGRQILLYRRRADPRLADVCVAIERGAATAIDAESVIALQRRTDAALARVMIASLHRADAAAIAREPIHQLFHHRLHDGDSATLGGRVGRFYIGQDFAFPGCALPWETLANAPWRINGRDYPITLDRAFTDALALLSPERLAGHGAVIAHGDAHNANVWLERDAAGAAPRLCLFDPAFAGRHVPALLAEVKATFHNILAHPFWLYDPAEAERRYSARVRLVDGVIEIEHDHALSPLRRAFLESKARLMWRPLLDALRARGWLPDDWERIVRLALFCGPTLVMDLRAGGSGGHNPTSAAIGLATAITLASAPAGDGPPDPVQDFLALATP